jgi:hypothetical protein
MIIGSRALGFALVCVAPAVAAASPIVCPRRVSAIETATAPEGWTANGRSERSQKPDGVSVLNRSAEGREYDLAPSGEGTSGTTLTQNWPLKDCRDMEVIVRCRYPGAITLKCRFPPLSGTALRSSPWTATGGSGKSRRRAAADHPLLAEGVDAQMDGAHGRQERRAFGVKEAPAPLTSRAGRVPGAAAGRQAGGRASAAATQAIGAVVAMMLDLVPENNGSAAYDRC